MLSTRKKYIYGAVLAVACGALAVNWMLGSGPEQAAAAGAAGGKRHPQGPGKSPASVQPARAAIANGQAPAENLAAASLRRLPEVREVRDLFARQNLKTGRSGSPDGSAGDGSDPDPVAGFLHTHELQATFQDGREVVALINRQVVRTGQAVDGFELVKVEPFRAIFRHQDLQAVLDLHLHPPGPKTQSGAASPGTSPANP